jgi:membrane-bound serine protease (ClpP class)
MRLVLKSRQWKTATGKEELLGEEGVVTIALPSDGEGMIRIHGELWRANSEASIPVGTKVRVLRVDGLKLDVEPLPAGTSIEK